MEKIPKIELNVNPNGITLQADRLINARFLPFLNSGRCKLCRSDALEVDFICDLEGVFLYCARLKDGRAYVPFDYKFKSGDVCQFRIRNKGRICNLEHTFGSKAPEEPAHKADADDEQPPQLDQQKPADLSKESAEIEKSFNELTNQGAQGEETKMNEE